ncbi:MAG: hypothetical protein R3A44_30650 [Caldilineaceae bacterium]
MDEQRMKRFAIPALIGLLLVVIIGSTAYNSGWSQGYMLGLLTSGRENAAAVAPYVMHGGHFGFFGGIFRFFFALLFIGFIFKAMRCFFWRMGGHHGHHPNWGHPGWGNSGGGDGGSGDGGSGDGGPQQTHWHRRPGPWGPQSRGPQNGPSQATEPTPQPETASRQEPIMYV